MVGGCSTEEESSLMIARKGISDFLLNVRAHLVFEGVIEFNFSVVNGLEVVLLDCHEGNVPFGIKGNWSFFKIEIDIPSTIFRNCCFIDSEGLWLKRLEHFILFLFDPFYPFYLFINQILIYSNLIMLKKNR